MKCGYWHSFFFGVYWPSYTCSHTHGNVIKLLFRLVTTRQILGRERACGLRMTKTVLLPSYGYGNVCAMGVQLILFHLMTSFDQSDFLH